MINMLLRGIDRVVGVASFIAGAVVSSSLIMLVSALYSSYSPVLDYVKPVGAWQIADDYIQVQLIGKKLRDCRRIPDSEVGYMILNKGIKETGFYYVDDETPDSSFPPGVINIGWTRWLLIDSGLDGSFTSTPVGSVQSVGYSMQHDCEGKVIVSQFRFRLPDD